MGTLKAVNRESRHGGQAWIVDRGRRFDIKNFLLRDLRGRIKVGERERARGCLALFAELLRRRCLAPLILMAMTSTAHAEKPSRIVSMNLCSDELVVRLAEPERIAALTYFAADPSVSNVSDEAKQFHLIRSQAEEVMRLSPDLVLAGLFTDRASVSLLKRMGYPVRMLELPRDFEGIRKNIREVANVLEESEKGERLIKKMNQTLQTLKTPIEPFPRVLFYQRGGYTPGAETFEDAMIQRAGARNISAEKGIKNYGVLPLEALMEAQPDFVIFSDFDLTRRSVGGWLLEHPALRQSRTIQTVTVPGRWLNCGGPLSAEAVLQLSKAFSGDTDK